MADETIQIKRYPNRRFYARNTSKYVSLPEIEAMIQQGHTVDVRDSQTGEEITQTVLAQIIMDRQPEKMDLFPIEMLHSIVRSNDVMTEFLRAYFRHSLTYLDYLKQHGASARELANPVNWVKAWLDGFRPPHDVGKTAPELKSDDNGRPTPELVQRLSELEERIRQLESGKQ